jgi:hypothetical protein
MLGVVRLLNHGDAPALLNGPQACRPIIQTAGEQDPHHAGAIGHGRGAKQGINGGPKAVFGGTASHAEAIRGQEQMVIRGSHIDMAAPQWLAVDGFGRREWSHLCQQIREHITRVGTQMPRNTQGGGEILWEVLHQRFEGV